MQQTQEKQLFKVSDVKTISIEKDTLVFLNIFRKEPQLRAWLINEFAGVVEDIRDVWARKHVRNNVTSLGVIPTTSWEYLQEEPIVSCDFSHILAFRSKDINLLKYIEFEARKRLQVRQSLDKVFGSEDICASEKEQMEQFIKQLLP